MANTVRIRNGMSNATEGDILGNFGDLVGVGVVDKANGHLLVTQDSPLGMSIQVAGGIVYVPNAGYNQLDSDTPKFYPVVCDAEALTIDNNTSGQTRNDIVCVKVDKSIFPDADASNIATKIVVKGTPGGGIPTTPANHYKLANIVVVNGETEITNAEITDTREQVIVETNKVDSTIDDKMAGIIDIILGGWSPITDTWTYNSTDNPTGVINWTGANSKVSAGMRIRFNNGGNTIYGIVTAVTGSTMTFLHEMNEANNNAVNLMANSAITNPFVSSNKAPLGFPLNPDKWSVFILNNSNPELGLTRNVWTNLSSLSLSIPIGSWLAIFTVSGLYSYGNTTAIESRVTLSTTNNGETDKEFSGRVSADGASAPVFSTSSVITRIKNITLTTKTTFYVNFMQTKAGTLYTGCEQRSVRATCAYL